MAGNSNEITMEQLGVLYSKVINEENKNIKLMKGDSHLERYQIFILKVFYGLNKKNSIEDLNNKIRETIPDEFKKDNVLGSSSFDSNNVEHIKKVFATALESAISAYRQIPNELNTVINVLQTDKVTQVFGSLLDDNGVSKQEKIKSLVAIGLGDTQLEQGAVEEDKKKEIAEMFNTYLLRDLLSNNSKYNASTYYDNLKAISNLSALLINPNQDASANANANPNSKTATEVLREWVLQEKGLNLSSAENTEYQQTNHLCSLLNLETSHLNNHSQIKYGFFDDLPQNILSHLNDSNGTEKLSSLINILIASDVIENLLVQAKDNFTEENKDLLNKAIVQRKLMQLLQQITNNSNDDFLLGALRALKIDQQYDEFKDLDAAESKAKLVEIIKGKTVDELTTGLASINEDNEIIGAERKALNNVKTLLGAGLGTNATLATLSDAVQACIESPSLNILALLDEPTKSSLAALNTYNNPNAINRFDVSNWENVKIALKQVNDQLLGFEQLNTKINGLLGTTDLDMSKPEDRYVFETMVNNGVRVTTNNKLELLDSKDLNGGTDSVSDVKKPLFTGESDKLIPSLKAINALNAGSYNINDLSSTDKILEKIIEKIGTGIPSADEMRQLNVLKQNIFTQTQNNPIDDAIIDKKLSLISRQLTSNPSDDFLVESLKNLDLATKWTNFSSYDGNLDENNLKNAIKVVIKGTNIETLNLSEVSNLLEKFPDEKTALQHVNSLSTKIDGTIPNGAKTLSGAVQECIQSSSLNILALLDVDSSANKPTNENLGALATYVPNFTRADVSRWDDVKLRLGVKNLGNFVEKDWSEYHLGQDQLNTKINELLNITENAQKLDMSKSQDRFVFRTMVENGVKVTNDNKLEFLNSTVLSGNQNSVSVDKKTLFTEKADELISGLRVLSPCIDDSHSQDFSDINKVRQYIVESLKQKMSLISLMSDSSPISNQPSPLLDNAKNALDEINRNTLFSSNKIQGLEIINQDKLVMTFNDIQKKKLDKGNGAFAISTTPEPLQKVIGDLKTLFGVTSDLDLNKKIRDAYNEIFGGKTGKKFTNLHNSIHTSFNDSQVKTILLKNFHNSLNPDELGLKLDDIFGDKTFANEIKKRTVAKALIDNHADNDTNNPAKNAEYVKKVVEILSILPQDFLDKDNVVQALKDKCITWTRLGREGLKAKSQVDEPFETFITEFKKQIHSPVLKDALFTRAEINEKRREINKIIVPAKLDKIKTLEDVFKRDITLETWRQIPFKHVEIFFDGQSPSYGHYLKKSLELNSSDNALIKKIKESVFQGVQCEDSKKAELNSASTFLQILQCVKDDKKVGVMLRLGLSEIDFHDNTFKQKFEKVKNIYESIIPSTTTTTLVDKDKILVSLAKLDLDTAIPKTDPDEKKKEAIANAFDNQLLSDLKENKTTIAKDNYENLKALVDPNAIINPNNTGASTTAKDFFEVMKEISSRPVANLDTLTTNYPAIGDFVAKVNGYIEDPNKLTIEMLKDKDTTALLAHISSNIKGDDQNKKLDNLIKLDAALGISKFSDIPVNSTTKTLNEVKEAYKTLSNSNDIPTTTNFTNGLSELNDKAILTPANYEDGKRAAILSAQQTMNAVLNLQPALAEIDSTIITSLQKLLTNVNDYSDVTDTTELGKFLAPFNTIPSVTFDSLKNGAYEATLKNLATEQEIQDINSVLKFPRSYFTRDVDINYILRDKLKDNQTIDANIFSSIGYVNKKDDNPDKIIRDIKACIYTKLSDPAIYENTKATELEELKNLINNINDKLSNPTDKIVVESTENPIIQRFKACCRLGKSNDQANNSVLDLLDTNGIKWETENDIVKIMGQLATSFKENKLSLDDLKTILSINNDKKLQQFMLEPVLQVLYSAEDKLTGIELLIELAKIEGYKLLSFEDLEALIDGEQTAPVIQTLRETLKNLKAIDTTYPEEEMKKKQLDRTYTLKTDPDMSRDSNDRQFIKDNENLFSRKIEAVPFENFERKINIYSRWIGESNDPDIKRPMQEALAYFAEAGVIKGTAQDDAKIRFDITKDKETIAGLLSPTPTPNTNATANPTTNLMDQVLNNKSLLGGNSTALFAIQSLKEGEKNPEKLQKLKVLERTIENEVLLKEYKECYTKTLEDFTTTLSDLRTGQNATPNANQTTETDLHKISNCAALEHLIGKLQVPGNAQVNQSQLGGVKELVKALDFDAVQDTNYKLYDVLSSQFSNANLVFQDDSQVKATINQAVREVFDERKIQMKDIVKSTNSEDKNTVDAVNMFMDYIRLKKSYEGVMDRVTNGQEDYKPIKLSPLLRLYRVEKISETNNERNIAENAFTSQQVSNDDSKPQNPKPFILDTKNDLKLKYGDATMTVSVAADTQHVKFSTEKSAEKEDTKPKLFKSVYEKVGLSGEKIVTTKLENMLDDSKTKNGLYCLAQSYMLNWKPGAEPKLTTQSPEEMKMLLMYMYLVHNQFKKTIPAFETFPFDRMELKVTGLSNVDCRKIQDEFLTYQKYITKDSKGDFRDIHKELKLGPNQKTELKTLAEDKQNDMLLQDMKKLLAVGHKYDSRDQAIANKEVERILDTSQFKDKLKEFVKEAPQKTAWYDVQSKLKFATDKTVDTDDLNKEIQDRSIKGPKRQ